MKITDCSDCELGFKVDCNYCVDYHDYVTGSFSEPQAKCLVNRVINLEEVVYDLEQRLIELEDNGGS